MYSLARVLLLYGCQVTKTLFRGESSSRAVFGRSNVETMELSEHFTTETLKKKEDRKQKHANRLFIQRFKHILYRFLKMGNIIL